MIKFRDSAEAENFVASAESRNTSKEILEAIVFFSRSISEAEALWNGDGIGMIANLTDIWEHATSNGQEDDTELHWGDRNLAQIMSDQC